MIRRPPRSPLFPYTTSSDLRQIGDRASSRRRVGPESGTVAPLRARARTLGRRSDGASGDDGPVGRDRAALRRVLEQPGAGAPELPDRAGLRARSLPGVANYRRAARPLGPRVRRPVGVFWRPRDIGGWRWAYG